MNLGGRTVLLTGRDRRPRRTRSRARCRARAPRLVLTGRRADALEPLASELGGRAIAADLARAATPSTRLLGGGRRRRRARRQRGAAGERRADSFTVEQIDRALAVNLRAPIVLARLLVERMVARGAGHLVFVSSLSGKSASAGSSLYSATKFGLRGFALALRQDLAGTGVGVSRVLPGLHPRRRHVRRLRRRAAAARRRRARPRTSPRRSCGRSSATAPRSTSRRWACGWAPRWRGCCRARGPRAAAAGLGPVAEAIADGQRDKRQLAEAGGEEAEIVGQGAVGEVGDARAQYGDRLGR